jgi:hypothetical protein
LKKPARIVPINTAEGWSRIGDELRSRCAERGEVPSSLQDFLDKHGS